MKLIYLFLINLFHLPVSIKGNDVLGCGGFIKSHVPIDFSKVEVKLVTKQGIVRDKTTCAPNNGYYFIPLYDKGELKLEISPPPGWSFNPKEVLLNIDGKDPCSQGKDINFNFEGFGITGKVESLEGGEAGGPSGVTVRLTSKDGTRTTQSTTNGEFTFTPVYPGSYSVSIEHPKWKIFKGALKVDVKEGNANLPSNSFLIQGYDVTGKVVTAEGSPIENTPVILYGENSSQKPFVEGCDKTPIPGIDLFLCHVKTNAKGEFVFSVVPLGNYYVAPYYKEENIYYKPKKIQFSVQHASVQLPQDFQVIGFTIPGKVTNGRSPLAKAKVFLNGAEVATTNDLGEYKLEKLKVGKYRLKAEAENMKFNEITVNIATNLPSLPELSPSAFKICGKVISDKPQVVSLRHKETAKVINTYTDQNQDFCEYLPIGHYEIGVKVSDEDKMNNLQFFPVNQKVEVLSENVGRLVFSQLKSNIHGRIKCIQESDCEGLDVILKNGQEELIIPVKNSEYSTTNINPGIYEISLSKNELCWNFDKQTVNVNSEKIEVAPFVHKGYKVHFTSSHETKMTYKSLIEDRTVELSIERGVSTICIDAPGTYVFSLESCHSFEQENIPHTVPADKNQITFNARKHLMELFVDADKDYGPVEMRVQLENSKFKQPLQYEDGAYPLRFTLRPQEKATITLSSSKLFFTPKVLEVVGGSECTYLGTQFTSMMGKLLYGYVKPRLAGVAITAENVNTQEKVTVESDSDGYYQFPPFDPAFEYKLIGEKESHIIRGPDQYGNFKAIKLAEINVRVLDEESKSPLPGVLLSLSGGQSFRSNLQTDQKGEITFHTLSASDYFLKPMLKEYRFEPASKLIKLEEGATIDVIWTGKRVAFSAFGKLVSVNEDPVENVNVVAVGVGNCSGLSEEATTDSNGAFRIRGLQPYCDFHVKVSDEPAVERTSPATIEIKGIHDDVKNLHIIVFHPVLITDVLVKVFAEKVEYYRSLKLTLYRESSSPVVLSSTPVDRYNTKMDENRNYGFMLHLPSLKLDNNDYSIHLESSHNLKSSPIVVNFKANDTVKYFLMHFNPKANLKEQPIKQTSVWAIFFILAALLVAYNIQTILAFVRQRLNFNFENILAYFPIPSNNKPVPDYDNDTIDQIVQDINNLKKRKPKKTN